MTTCHAADIVLQRGSEQFNYFTDSYQYRNSNKDKYYEHLCHFFSMLKSNESINYQADKLRMTAAMPVKLYKISEIKPISSFLTRG